MFDRGGLDYSHHLSTCHRIRRASDNISDPLIYVALGPVHTARDSLMKGGLDRSIVFLGAIRITFSLLCTEG